MPRPAFVSHLISSAAGACIDNIGRFAAGAALIAYAGRVSSNPSEASALAEHLGLWATFSFMLPFVIFAPLAGDLGDRVGKHRIMRVVRVADLGVVALVVLGMASGDAWWLIGALAMLGVASSFNAPVKLAVLPELVPAERLPGANGALQAVTIVAVLLGTILGGLAADGQMLSSLGWTLGVPAAVALVMGVIAIIGVIAVWRIPALPAAQPTRSLRPFGWWRLLTDLGCAKGLWAPALSVAGFYAVGVVAQTLIQPVSHAAYALEPLQQSLVQLVLALGIIAGAVLTPYLISRAFPAWLPSFGALITALALIGAGLCALTHAPLFLYVGLFFVAGVGAGLWEIPLITLLQERAPHARR